MTLDSDDSDGDETFNPSKQVLMPIFYILDTSIDIRKLCGG